MVMFCKINSANTCHPCSCMSISLSHMMAQMALAQDHNPSSITPAGSIPVIAKRWMRSRAAADTCFKSVHITWARMHSRAVARCKWFAWQVMQEQLRLRYAQSLHQEAVKVRVDRCSAAHVSLAVLVAVSPLCCSHRGHVTCIVCIQIHSRHMQWPA